MNFLGGFDDAGLEALLTQGVLFDFSVSDSFPRSAVGVLIIGALVLVVKLLCLGFVLRAVLFTRRGEAGTTLVSARSVWLGRHSASSFRGKQKALGDCSLKALYILFR